MRVKVIYKYSNCGSICRSVVDTFITGDDIDNQIKTIFETRIAPLDWLISYNYSKMYSTNLK